MRARHVHHHARDTHLESNRNLAAHLGRERAHVVDEPVLVCAPSVAGLVDLRTHSLDFRTSYIRAQILCIYGFGVQLNHSDGAVFNFKLGSNSNANVLKFDFDLDDRDVSINCARESNVSHAQYTMMLLQR